MLHDLDKTLEKLLIEEGKLNKNEIDISFEQPTGDWSAHLNRPTLNCWCFDLRENVKLRTSMDTRVTRNGMMGRTSFPPKRIDLTYLITAWARKIEDEHQLLWRALGALKRNPMLKPEDGQGMVRHQEHDIPLVVADMSDNSTNLVDLWSVLDNEMRLGFILVATVELDTELGFDGPLVLEATFDIGQSNKPANKKMSALDVELRHRADRKSDRHTREEAE